MSPEERPYAGWLDAGTRVALALLVASFLAYALGLLEPLLPMHELPKLWSLPVDRFVAASGAPTGWGWLGLVRKGDYLMFIPVVLLCLITAVCYARILVFLFRDEKPWRAAIALAQILVLLGAALIY